jgi:hypothetical protein
MNIRRRKAICWAKRPIRLFLMINGIASSDLTRNRCSDLLQRR